MKKLLFISCVLAVATLAAVSQSFARTTRIEGAEVTLIEVGDVAPDFNLFGVDMQYHSLDRYKEKDIVVVIFHCNHCPISQRNVDLIVELGNEYQQKGVQFLLINPNPADKVPRDGYEQMKARAEEKNFPFPYLYDETQMTAIAYGARRTDHVYVLGAADEEGARKVVYIGPVDNRHSEPVHLADALDSLLAGEEIERSEIETFGCTIKYRNAAERRARFGYDPLAD